MDFNFENLPVSVVIDLSIVFILLVSGALAFFRGAVREVLAVAGWAAAAAADFLCQYADELACLNATLDQIVGHGSNEESFAVGGATQDGHRVFLELLADLLAEVAEGLHVGAGDLAGDEADTVHILRAGDQVIEAGCGGLFLEPGEFFFERLCLLLEP